jgi:beta-glucosidase
MRNDIFELVWETTLAEKSSIYGNLDSWHTVVIARHCISSVMMEDGPNGIRKEVVGSGNYLLAVKSLFSTCYPTDVALA